MTSVAGPPQILHSTPDQSSLQFSLADVGVEATPSFEKYVKRREILASNRKSSHESLPTGFPEVADSPATWSSETLSYEDLLYTLCDREIAEVESALDFFNASSATLDEISTTTFPLPSLGQKLRSFSDGIYSGHGAAALRGLRPDKYCPFDNTVIFAGISSHVAAERGVQSKLNDYLVHIRTPEDKAVPGHAVRFTFTRNALPFHNDSCDVIAMYVMEGSSSGGQGYWASSAQVYNEIVATRPGLISTLAKSDWPFEKYGSNQFGEFVACPADLNISSCSESLVSLRPLLYPGGNRPFLYYSRINLTGSMVQPRSAEIPQLSDVQADALDTLHFTAAKHAVVVPQQKGDMYFINNLAILHARDAYADGPGGHGRHLMRLWLSDERFGYRIPQGLKWRWDEVFGDSAKQDGRWTVEKEHSTCPIFIPRSLYNDESSGSTS